MSRHPPNSKLKNQPGNSSAAYQDQLVDIKIKHIEPKLKKFYTKNDFQTDRQENHLLY